MISLKKVQEILLLTGLFFFSFNDYQGIAILGEFKREAGAIFFFIGFALLVAETSYTKKISIPFKSTIFQILLLFIIWCFITTVLNTPTVIVDYFKHTGGISRFLRQYVSLLISTIIFFLFYWNVMAKMSIKDILFKIRKVFFLSLVVASIYGFLETAVVFFGMHFLLPLLKIFDYFPFLEVVLDFGMKRISSICYESPSLAIYLITIAGWMFSYILTEKGILKFVPAILVLLLTFFSGSRTGLVVVFFQLLIFMTILYRKIEFRKYIGYAAIRVSLVFAVLLVLNGQKITKAISDKLETLDFKSNLTKNVSNQSRFGMQYASLQVFKENPIVGVGFGQQTYFARYHYPYWATKNNYEFKLFYKNQAESSFPPTYNLYTRLLAETGIVGILIILFLIYQVIVKTKFLIRNRDNEQQILAYILLITFSGLFVNWLQIDSFRMYGIWLSIAILIKMLQEKGITNE